MNWIDGLALAAQAPAAAPETGSPFSIFPVLAVILVIFYLLIVRPQKKEQQAAQSMRESLKKGDRVKTIGGIHGVVTTVDETTKTVRVRVDRNVELELDKAAIATVIRDEKPATETSTSK